MGVNGIIRLMNAFAVLLAVLLPLSQAAWDGVDRRIASSDPDTVLSRFVNYPAGADKDRFVLNPKFWAKGIDFSCVSPWNSAGGALRAGTLISKRHIIFAKHFPLATGTRIVFVGEDGGVCPCYIEKTKAVDKCDIMIGLLNAEVTPNIHPAKILPSDYAKYLGDCKGLPVVTFNQKEKLLLTEASAMPTNAVPYRGFSSHAPHDEYRARFREKIVVGDSGNPAFLLVANQPILICCLFSGGAGAGPTPHTLKLEVQAAMDELCPGYKLEEFDFKSLKGKLK